jgi:hypothetical protein
MTNVFQEKYKEFTKDIEKFSSEDVKAIKNVIRAEEFYSGINKEEFTSELKKWIKILQFEPTYKELSLKCQKLLELA